MFISYFITIGNNIFIFAGNQQATLRPVSHTLSNGKWQCLYVGTCKNTQSPLVLAAMIIFSATGPCPWPSEMECTRSRMPISVANFWNAPNGSEPVLRTNTSGVVDEVSA